MQCAEHTGRGDRVLGSNVCPLVPDHTGRVASLARGRTLSSGAQRGCCRQVRAPATVSRVRGWSLEHARLSEIQQRQPALRGAASSGQTRGQRPGLEDGGFRNLKEGRVWGSPPRPGGGFPGSLMRTRRSVRVLMSFYAEAIGAQMQEVTNAHPLGGVTR